MSVRWIKFRDFNYEVNACGVVRNATTKRELKPSMNWNGYAAVSMFHGGKYHRKMLARIVAECWVYRREIPQHLHVNHIDFDRLNNSASNLEIVSPQQNVQHSAKAGRLATGERNGAYTQPQAVRRGERINLAKLTSDDVRRMRALRHSGLTYREIAKQFGVTPNATSEAVRGKTWAHV